MVVARMRVWVRVRVRVREKVLALAVLKKWPALAEWETSGRASGDLQLLGGCLRANGSSTPAAFIGPTALSKHHREIGTPHNGLSNPLS